MIHFLSQNQFILSIVLLLKCIETEIITYGN